jgi:hypothetical protein
MIFIIYKNCFGNVIYIYIYIFSINDTVDHNVVLLLLIYFK